MPYIKNPIMVTTKGKGAAKPEETKSVELSLAAGDQVVTPSAGSVLAQVTIEKPATLISNNIKDGVDIAGVVGTYQAGVAQPKLNAVTIARNGTSFTITNPTSNGAFVNGYKIYDNGNVITTTTSTTYSMTGLNVGTHKLMAAAKGNNFDDAAGSNVLTVKMLAVDVNLTGLTNSNTATKILDGQTYTAKLTPATGKYLPESITVTQDGEAVDYTYDEYAGGITIEDVQGDIEITATAWDVNQLHTPKLALEGDGKTLNLTGVRYAATYEVYADDLLIKTLHGVAYKAACNETTGGTTLTTTIDCNVGDVLIAAIVTRSTFEISDGWTLLSTSQPISGDSNNQRLAWAKKIATATSESITVTQASNARIYTTIIALPGDCSNVTDHGYSYSGASATSLTVSRPAGLTLTACSCPTWTTTGDRQSWKCSADTAQRVDLATTQQPRLAVFLDLDDASDVTYTVGATSALTVGSLSIDAPTYEFVVVGDNK